MVQHQRRQGTEEQSTPVGIYHKKAQQWGELGFPVGNASLR
jgi:hypothetical protein